MQGKSVLTFTMKNKTKQIKQSTDFECLYAKIPFWWKLSCRF